MVNIIETEWDKFFKAIHPNGTSEVQRRETYKAFLAGVACVFALIGEAAKVPGEDESVRVLRNISDGLHESMLGIIGGYKARN